jgi:hypothetical protein
VKPPKTFPLVSQRLWNSAGSKPSRLSRPKRLKLQTTTQNRRRQDGRPSGNRTGLLVGWRARDEAGAAAVFECRGHRRLQLFKLVLLLFGCQDLIPNVRCLRVAQSRRALMGRSSESRTPRTPATVRDVPVLDVLDGKDEGPRVLEEHRRFQDITRRDQHWIILEKVTLGWRGSIETWRILRVHSMGRDYRSSAASPISLLALKSMCNSPAQFFDPWNRVNRVIDYVTSLGARSDQRSHGRFSNQLTSRNQ